MITPTPYAGPQPAWTVYQSHDEVQLRQQYAKLAAKRAERMEVQELKKGIAEMRRHDLIAELTELAAHSEGFDKMRATVAVAALLAIDRPQLQELSSDWAKELAKPTEQD
jgi:hypothetical protein